MKYGARNIIEGKVLRIKKGDVMGQVSLEVTGDNTLSSVMTAESLEELNLNEGDRVKAVVKAISIMLVKEED